MITNPCLFTQQAILSTQLAQRVWVKIVKYLRSAMGIGTRPVQYYNFGKGRHILPHGIQSSQLASQTISEYASDETVSSLRGC